MEPIYYEALTKRKNQEQAMKAVLNEMVTYFIYVSIIFMLAYGNRDHSLLLQKQQLETTIIFGNSQNFLYFLINKKNETAVKLSK